MDHIDHQIIEALQHDGNLSNKELAGIIGLAPSSCLERVRKLKQQGVITGTHATIDPNALGITLQAMIAIQVRQHSRDMVDAFHDYAQQLPEVIALYHVAGAHDFLAHVAVRDAQHLRDFALDSLTTRPEVRHIETSLIFSHTRQPKWPCYRDVES